MLHVPPLSEGAPLLQAFSPAESLLGHRPFFRTMHCPWLAGGAPATPRRPWRDPASMRRPEPAPQPGPA